MGGFRPASAGDVHGLRRALTSFVGRADEIAKAAGMLSDSRMVTITGPGGVGKTRLAGEVARQVAGRFADGVWLAELAAVADPALLPVAIAGAIGVQQVPGTPGRGIAPGGPGAPAGTARAG